MNDPGAVARRVALEGFFAEALRAVDPARLVRDAVRVDAGASGLHLSGRPTPEDARLFVVAAGKAAVPMAEAFAARARDRIEAGLAVTKDGHGQAPAPFATLAAAHPVPDRRSARAGEAVLELAARARPGDALVVLLSGGASALLALPQPPLSFTDLAEATRILLRAGAPIGLLNAVRKQLTRVSGGRLAAATPAEVHVLAISDVPGDDPSTIASGPCAPEARSREDVVGELRGGGWWTELPREVQAHLDGAAGPGATPCLAPGDPRFVRVHTSLLATNRDAVEAALEAGESAGWRVVDLGQVLSGEAREVGRRLARQGAEGTEEGPTLRVAGGETTVRVTGGGRGGRSQELALAAAEVLDGRPGVTVLAAGTDGTDGPTDAAGAFADGGTLARGRAAGVSASGCLERNDAYGFFAAEGGLLRTGPTGTNVMDLVLIARGDAG